MNFTSVDVAISNLDLEESRDRITQLLLDLGVRHNNVHVGTGMGGNMPQFMVLSAAKHHLVSSDSIPKFTIHEMNGTCDINWNLAYLKRVSNKGLREDIHRSFGDVLSASKGMPLSMQMSQALLLCQELAQILDSNQDSSNALTAVGNVLKDFPMEIILVSVRTQIGIDRLVKHNMDEHPVWDPIFRNINKTVSSVWH